MGVPPGIHLPFDFAQGKRGCLAEALTAVRPFASNSFDGLMPGVPVPWLEL